MAKKWVPTEVTLPDGRKVTVPIEIDEEHEKRIAEDPDYAKPPTEVVDEVLATALACHVGRTDVDELRTCVVRLARLVKRGIGTSPSEPPPANDGGIIVGEPKS